MQSSRIFIVAFFLSASALGAAAYKGWLYRSAAIEAQIALASLQADVNTLKQDAHSANERATNSAAKIDQLVTEAQSLRRQLVITATKVPPSSPALPLSRTVRDYVYRTNIVGSSRTAKTGQEMFANLGGDGYEQLCGGMSMAYAWALREMGIPARTVQLAAETYLTGVRRGDTHVTVEAFIDGAWRISDPTFNVEFDCSDGKQSLDTVGAHQCVAQGGQLVANLGETQIAGRTLDDYYSSYENFLAAYDVQPYSDESVSAPRQTYPTSNWRAEARSHYL